MWKKSFTLHRKNHNDHTPSIPYEKNALEPHISEKTFSFHYDKHHQAYVTNLNSLIVNTPFADLDLETNLGKVENFKEKK